MALMLALGSAGVDARPRQSTARAADDPVASTLAAEFALQAGRPGEAAAGYLAAAKAVDGDIGLAERATRIALYAKDERGSREALALWRERAPRVVAMDVAQATIEVRAGRARPARRALELLLRDPDPLGWRGALAVLGSESPEPEFGATLLAGLVDDGLLPTALPPWLAAGGLALQFEDLALAGRIVEQVVARHPDEPQLALLRAAMLREAGDIDGARAALVALVETKGLTPPLRLRLAAELDGAGDPAAAAAVMARGPQDDRSLAVRAALLAKAEDKVALQALYEQLEAGGESPDPGRRLLLGQTAEYLDHHAEALAWYRGVPGGEQRWEARLRAAKVLHDLDRDAEAFADLRALQQDAAADEETRRNAYLLEAELHATDEDVAAETDTYARGLAAYPDEGALLYARALMWERTDDIPRAEADLRRILVADPENVAALNALGYTLADRTDRYREALELIDRARLAEPASAAIIDSHGWVLYRLGRTEEALSELRRAYALQKDPEIGAHLGEVLWVLGRRDEARKYFLEARRLDADNRSLQRAIEETGIELGEEPASPEAPVLPPAPAPAPRSSAPGGATP